MSKKVTDDTPMVIMDDLDDILMEDLDDILAETGSGPDKKKTDAPAETPAAEEMPAAEEPPAAGGIPIAEEPPAAEETPASEEPPAAGEAAVTEEATPAEEQADRREGRILGMYDTPEADQNAGDKDGKNGAAKPGAVKSGKKRLWKKILAACAAVILLGVLGAYGYGVYYYTGHFLPGTAVAEVPLDNLTVEEAQAKLTAAKKAEDSILTLTTLDGQQIPMDTSAMNITRSYTGLPGALAAQEKWLFLFNKNEAKAPELDYGITYDRDAAQNCLKALEICDPEKTTAPQDAYVARDGRGNWAVIPAVDGDTVDLEKLTAAVVGAIDGRQKELNIRDSGAYLTAEVYETDPMLIRKAEVENKIDELEFTVDMGADTFHTVTADEFRELLVEGVEYEEAPETILDKEKFEKFMDRLSRSYTTKSASGYRYFKSVTGNRIAMKSDYGWDMDREKTAEIIGTMLEQAGRKALVDENLQETYPLHQVEAVWNQTAVSHGERDTGESWVEVNITQQKMYCVIDGEIRLESNVVSGTETVKDRQTPGGIFAVRFKSTERDLVGYNADGTESYRSHVHYWMPVYKNIGLHDATWRGSFGGKIYKYSGSHGCVNLPLKTAKELYEMVEKGMPVIIYRENIAYTAAD